MGTHSNRKNTLQLQNYISLSQKNNSFTAQQITFLKFNIKYLLNSATKVG